MTTSTLVTDVIGAAGPTADNAERKERDRSITYTWHVDRLADDDGSFDPDSDAPLQVAIEDGHRYRCVQLTVSHHKAGYRAYERVGNDSFAVTLREVTRDYGPSRRFYSEQFWLYGGKRDVRLDSVDAGKRFSRKAMQAAADTALVTVSQRWLDGDDAIRTLFSEQGSAADSALSRD